MKHLIDACVFIHKLDTGDKMICLCNKLKNDVYTSNIVLDELETKDPAKNEINTMVTNMIKYKQLKLFDINSDQTVKKNFDDIRNRYYGWMKKPEYLRKLIKERVITESEVKSYGFKFKDYGECSLIAIALIDIENTYIITEDMGRVYLHPDINIFKKYNMVKVMNFDELNKKKMCEI